ncbi:MAG TPA: SURF1 family protein [Fontimonas sp.]
MTDKTFKPNLWAAIGTVLLCGLFCTLGAWQLQRGMEKAEIIERFDKAAAKAPRAISAGSWAEKGVVETAQTSGTYDGERQLLLDGQSHDSTPGYRVWTPLRLAEGGGILMVDRGWIPGGGDRAQLPALPVPAGVQSIAGYFRTLPVPGMRTEADNCVEGPWPRIVQYPTIEDLRCLYGPSIAVGLLLLSADAEGGFVREWTSGPEMSPTKHYGYAGQWFLFAVVLAVLFIRLSFKPKT